MTEDYERETCPWCGRIINMYAPKGGDGSYLIFRLHTSGPGVRCEGSKQNPFHTIGGEVRKWPKDGPPVKPSTPDPRAGRPLPRPKGIFSGNPLHREVYIQVADPAAEAIAKVLEDHPRLGKSAGWIGSPDPGNWRNISWICNGCNEKVSDLTHAEPFDLLRRHQAAKILERITA